MHILFVSPPLHCSILAFGTNCSTLSWLRYAFFRSLPRKNPHLLETGGTAISFLLTFWKRAEQPFPFCIRCFIHSFKHCSWLSFASPFARWSVKQPGTGQPQDRKKKKENLKKKNFTFWKRAEQPFPFCWPFWKRAEQPFPFCTHCFIYSRRTPQYPSNKHKNNFISRALKKGPVLLQETKWTNEHYRHMLHTWPEIPLAHSPAISLHNGLSGGTAILLPPAWSIIETVEIVPGYVIAVKAKQAGYLVWFVSMYTKIPLDRHWMQRTLTSTAQTIKGQPAFIGIDCNNVDKTFTELWTNFLTQADLVDIAPALDTYFYQGGSSPLDRILVPSLMVDAAHLHATAYCMHFYDKFGHQPVQGRIQCPPKLAIHPDSIKHETIPTAAFCAPITMHNSADSSIYHASMGRLIRALYDHVDPNSDTKASVKATIWTWWRKAKTERSLPNKMVGLYKYLTGPSSHAVVKTELLQELCQTVSHPMLANVTQFPSIGNCSVIPKATLVEGLNLTKELINDYHNV